MRQIKIRVWIPENHEMVPMLTISDDFHPMILLTPPEGNGWIAMQFTGLNDKNGKEIYEGDILTNGDADSRWTVRHLDDVGYYCLCETNGDLCESHPMRTSHLEVIGNIYEDPELLHEK